MEKRTLEKHIKSRISDLKRYQDEFGSDQYRHNSIEQLEFILESWYKKVRK